MQRRRSVALRVDVHETTRDAQRDNGWRLIDGIFSGEVMQLWPLYRKPSAGKSREWRDGIWEGHCSVGVKAKYAVVGNLARNWKDSMIGAFYFHVWLDRG